MRLFSWNVNGVRAIEKKGFLDWVDSTSPDILCIQETKANFDQLPESLQNIHGYHGYWHSGERKGYSGVATFCKNEPLDVQYGLGIEKFDREGRVLITEFEDFLLYNIYFPNQFPFVFKSIPASNVIFKKSTVIIAVNPHIIKDSNL